MSPAVVLIGTVFDDTMIEGVPGRDSQTINLAPSQGGWVDFTLDEEGTYPFVDHSSETWSREPRGAPAGGVSRFGAPLGLGLVDRGSAPTQGAHG
jgi:hypothetical protein